MTASAIQTVQRGEVDGPQAGAAVPESPGEADSGDPNLADEEALLRMLPSRIGGFRTAARHMVPGLESEMAEAIYKPLDEEVRVRTPLNCYVAVRAIGPDKVGEEFAAFTARHPGSVPPPDVGAGADEVFAARDRSTYVIAWRQAGYLVIVDTRFTLATPVEQEGQLELHGEAVASAVLEEMGR